MGWGRRFLAGFIGFVALALGAWPVSMFSAVYIAYSFRRNDSRRAVERERAFRGPGRSRGRHLLAGVLLLFAAIAAAAGGTFSPIVFSTCGLAVMLWPFIRRRSLAQRVVPLRDSILLRSRLVPIRWHALVEVKLEAQGQTRGVSSMDGTLLVFTGRTPSAFQVVSVYALGYQAAEEKIVGILRKETEILSQRGAHLLPLDSASALLKLSLSLERLKVNPIDLESVALPFDVLSLHAEEGLVLGHSAFRITEVPGPPCVPPADQSAARRPLLVEVVEKIEERHGWPGPDEFSPFLAALDASRAEPLADRFRTNGGLSGEVNVVTPGGAEVRMTRSQLRMIARIYG